MEDSLALRRTFRYLAAAGAIIAVGAAFALGRETAPAHSTPNTTTTTAVPAASPLMQALAGEWDHHGFHMFVNSNGSGEFQWRTYRSCPPDQPPCDLPYEESGWADFQLTQISAKEAKAQVGGTTDPTLVPTSGFTVLYDDQHDLMELSIPPGARTTMCGPRAAGPQVINCGA